VGCALPVTNNSAFLFKLVGVVKVKNDYIIAIMHENNGEIAPEKNKAEHKNKPINRKKGVSEKKLPWLVVLFIVFLHLFMLWLEKLLYYYSTHC